MNREQVQQLALYAETGEPNVDRWLRANAFNEAWLNLAMEGLNSGKWGSVRDLAYYAPLPRAVDLNLATGREFALQWSDNRPFVITKVTANLLNAQLAATPTLAQAASPLDYVTTRLEITQQDIRYPDGTLLGSYAANLGRDQVESRLYIPNIARNTITLVGAIDPLVTSASRINVTLWCVFPNIWPNT